MSRVASCHCGNLQLTCEGEPLRVTICHCHDCQRRTGSIFGVQARFPKDSVSIEGEFRTYTREGDSGDSLSFNFCPECGSTMFYYFEVGGEDFIGIPVGSFAERDFPEPTISIYGVRQHSWLRLPDSVKQYD